MRVGLMVGAIGLVWLFGCQPQNSSVSTPQHPPSPPETKNSTEKPEKSDAEPAERTIPTYTYRVVDTFPHDRQAFTQGLQFYNGWLYEGTGLEGRSTLRKVELRKGRVLQSRRLGEEYFGEGITIFNDHIYQITWKSGVCFVYDRESFHEIKRFRYTGEGWGLTHDSKYLIMSDGSDTLYFRDPETFEIVRRVQVHANRVPVRNINELEYIEGEVWANIWQTDMIARINPKTGEVVGWIDMEGLINYLPDRDRFYAEVLNGIAYDSKNKRIFVTGKLWSRLFEIEVMPKRNSD